MERGQRFSRLTALKEAPRSSSKNAQWYFRCDCGKQTIGRVIDVTRGLKQSCGCLHRERFKGNKYGLTHGMFGTSIYNTWAQMIQRCENPKARAFLRYGKRGITVCKRWRDSFEAFYADMGPRPDPSHSLERIDNAKGYCKANCRWATRSQQNKNKDHAFVRMRPRNKKGQFV